MINGTRFIKKLLFFGQLKIYQEIDYTTRVRDFRGKKKRVRIPTKTYSMFTKRGNLSTTQYVQGQSFSYPKELPIKSRHK